MTAKFPLVQNSGLIGEIQSGDSLKLPTPLAISSGGTNQSTYTLGDTLYASATNTLSKLAGNTTNSLYVLTQTGTGSVSAAPVWEPLSSFGVTSVTGGVNQIAVTTTSGNAVVSLANGIALGSYQLSALNIPTGGMLIPGNVSIGYINTTALFNAGSLNQFQVDTSGNTSIKTLSVDIPATTFSSAASTSSIGSGIAYGWRFTPNVDIYLDNLGINDTCFSSGTRNVAIYLAGGNQIVNSSVVKGSTLNNGFRITSIPTIKLFAGTAYVVVGLFNSGDTAVISVNSGAYSSSLTFNSGRNSGTLSVLPAIDPTSDTGVGPFPDASFLFGILNTNFAVTASNGNGYALGNWGVGGITSPTQALHVNGSILTQGSATAGYDALIRSNSGNNSITVAAGKIYGTSDTFSSANLTLGAYNSSTKVDIMTLTNLGQIGMGISTIASTDFVRINSPGGTATQLRMDGNNTTTSGLATATDQISLSSFVVNKCPASTTTGFSSQAYFYNYIDISNAAAVVTRAASVYIGAGQQINSTGSGSSITAGYGLYIENPGIGTSKTSAFLANLSVGYTAVTPPSNGAVIAGALSIGSSSNTYKLDVTGGHIGIMTLGSTLRIASGTNGCIGSATLSAGTVTVSTAAIATGDLIFITCTAAGGVQGFVREGTITDGISFTLVSSNIADTSTYNWVILKKS